MPGPTSIVTVAPATLSSVTTSVRVSSALRIPGTIAVQASQASLVMYWQGIVPYPAPKGHSEANGCGPWRLHGSACGTAR
jgi:hypothetical protein